MKLMSYEEALRAGKEAIKEMLIPIKVTKMRKQAELEMCKIDEDIANKTSTIQEKCCSEDINFRELINLQDDLALLERRKSQYKQIIDQMFPEEVK